MNLNPDSIIRVSIDSVPGKTAGAVAHMLRYFGQAEINAVGTVATSKALSIMSIASEYARNDGYGVTFQVESEVLYKHEDTGAPVFIIIIHAKSFPLEGQNERTVSRSIDHVIKEVAI